MDIKYHYTSSEGLMGIVDSMELHCSRIDFLNDPSEASYFDVLLEEVLSNPDCKAIYDELYSQSYFILNTHSIYIASFCHNSDLLPMWKHYSKGNGCCIGFDIDDIVEYNKSSDVFIEKEEIVYDRYEQKKLIFDLIMSFNERLISAKESNRHTSVTSDRGEEIVLFTDLENLGCEFTSMIMVNRYKFKHRAYSDESEIRIILKVPNFYADNNLKKRERFKISKNGVIIECFPLKLPSKDVFHSINIHPQSSELQELGVRNYIEYQLGYGFSKEISKSIIPFREV